MRDIQLSYIKIFVDCLESIEPLDDAERGRLFTALLEYARTGEKPALQGNERFIFPTLRAQLDRDAVAYENLCEMNSRKGAMGGRPSKKAAAFPESRKSQDKEKEEEKEKEKDSSRQTGGLPDRTSGRRPNAGPQREKSFSRRRTGADSPGDMRKDVERMQRFLLQLRKEREEMDRQEAEREASSGAALQPDPAGPAGAKEFYGL